MTSWGRLPMNAVDRRSGAHSLDGDWRFQLLPAPDAPVGGPGRGGRARRLDHAGHRRPAAVHERPDAVARVPPRSRPRPIRPGVYEREVDVPAEWAGRRIVLQVGAAESVLLVHVDGRPVGVSKDSHLAAEFDLTASCAPAGGAVVRLTVVKWSDASHIEDQDQWWHGGITRSVLLYATDPLHLADVTVRARCDGDLRVDCQVRDAGGALPEGWYVSGELDGPAGSTQDAEFDRSTPRTSGSPTSSARPGCATRVPERPHLDRRDARAVRPDRPAAPRRRHGRRHLAPPRRLPRGRDRGQRPAGQRRARADPGRQPARLRPAARARPSPPERYARRPVGDEAVRVQRRAHVALPERPGPARRSRDELGLYVIDEADIECHAYAHHVARRARATRPRSSTGSRGWCAATRTTRA